MQLGRHSVRTPTPSGACARPTHLRPIYVGFGQVATEEEPSGAWVLGNLWRDEPLGKGDDVRHRHVHGCVAAEVVVHHHAHHVPRLRSTCARVRVWHDVARLVLACMAELADGFECPVAQMRREDVHV